ELRNVIRTALAICDGGVVRLSDLPSEVRGDGDEAGATFRTSETRGAQSDAATASAVGAQTLAADRDEILRTIHDCAGNMSRAARRLGVSRNTLYRRCRQLGIPLRRAPAGH
ncbi:MAG TPA: helix-turn-helix domain-containing protein, partial [Steroidobacter sp.]|nr:helix-turn-helix domain-containing protein [Steroidobacter sp.]